MSERQDPSEPEARLKQARVITEAFLRLHNIGLVHEGCVYTLVQRAVQNGRISPSDSKEYASDIQTMLDHAVSLKFRALLEDAEQRALIEDFYKKLNWSEAQLLAMLSGDPMVTQEEMIQLVVELQQDGSIEHIEKLPDGSVRELKYVRQAQKIDTLFIVESVDTKIGEDYETMDLQPRPASPVEVNAFSGVVELYAKLTAEVYDEAQSIDYDE